MVYNNGSMCNFSPFSPLNQPFNVIMLCKRSFFFLFYSQNLSIPFRDPRRTSSPRKPPQKPITTSVSKQDIYLILIRPSIPHYTSYTPNKAFIISLETPKSCLLITPIQSFDPRIKFPNHGPLVGHTVYLSFSPSLELMVSPNTNTPAPYKFTHAVGPFLMLSHCMLPTYLPLLRDILRATQATPIPTSSFRG